MRKYKFIHPVTGVAYEVLCEQVQEYGTSAENYWWCLIGDKIIAQIPQSYAMISINETI
jgi:flagellar biosynthesis component FlhA